MSFWKRRVAECCLYGVDLNALAVELAKLALWLETVAVNRPLTFLDHHLRVGNSLMGARLSELGALPQEIALRTSAVAQRVEEQLPVLLAPLAEIRQTPSDTVEQIKEKSMKPTSGPAATWLTTRIAARLSLAARPFACT